MYLSHCPLSIHYVKSYNSYLKRWNEHRSFWYLALFLREWHAQASSAHFLRSIVNSWRRRKSNAPRQNPVHEYRADENIRREREARVSLASMLMSLSSLDSCEILMHCKGLPGKFSTSQSFIGSNGRKSAKANQRKRYTYSCWNTMHVRTFVRLKGHHDVTTF